MNAPDLSAAVWRKSSRSNGGGANCVEVAFVADVTALRDSKNPDGAALVFDNSTFHAFLDKIKRGGFAG